MPTLLHYDKAAKRSEASPTVLPIGARFPGPAISGTF
jgi:hypothetical protein